MNFSIIQKSQLEGAHRLDAEYYQPEYLQIGKLLFSSPNLLSLCTKITDFGAYSQMNFVKYSDSGVRFLRNQDVGEVSIENSEPIFIPLETYKKLSLKLEEYDLVIPRVGTLGNAAVVQNNHLPASANQNLAQIKPNLEKIDPYYLAVFLSSKFGRKQFERLATGNVQPWLNLSQINSLKVFISSPQMQNDIKKIIFESLQNLVLSKQLYSNAEDLLLEELGLKDFKDQEDLTFVVNFSEVEKAKRLDADYFQSKYESLVNKLGSKKRLSEFAKRVNTPVKIVPDKQYNYIEISDVNVESGEIVFNIITGKELPANAKIKVSGGELIISKVRPTRGAIAIIPQEFTDDFIVSGAFSVFKVDYPTREYLQVVFRSIIGKLQLERPTTGTSYPTITDDDIENMWIPDSSFNLQQKIADLVRKSHEKRKKSKELLEEAKSKVEEMIEKGSD